MASFGEMVMSSDAEVHDDGPRVQALKLLKASGFVLRVCRAAIYHSGDCETTQTAFCAEPYGSAARECQRYENRMQHSASGPVTNVSVAESCCTGGIIAWWIHAGPKSRFPKLRQGPLPKVLFTCTHVRLPWVLASGHMHMQLAFFRTHMCM